MNRAEKTMLASLSIILCYGCLEHSQSLLSRDLHNIGSAAVETPVAKDNSPQSHAKAEALVRKWDSEYLNAQALENRGDERKAEAAYTHIITSGHDSGRARFALGRLLDRLGRLTEAAVVLRPFALPSQREASIPLKVVLIYEKYLRATSGTSGLLSYRDRIRNCPIDGMSLAYYNSKGLTDQGALGYLEAREAISAGQYSVAEALLAKIVLHDHPTWNDPYEQLRYIYCQTGRQREVASIYENWYRSADEATRERLKKEYNLDFRRLDAMSKP